MNPDLPTDLSLSSPARQASGPFKVGYYRPTYAFNQVQEFMALLSQEDEPVCLTGSSMSREAALNAKLFCMAPELRQQLQVIYDTLLENSRLPFADPERQESMLSSEALSLWLRDTERLLKALEHCP